MPGEPESSSQYDVYDYHSKTLRAWFVAYGAGGPALILSKEEIRKPLVNYDALTNVLTVFMLGVSMQILASLLNKFAAWHMYEGDGQTLNYVQYRHKKRYRLSKWISDLFVIDMSVDVATLISLGLSTYMAITILTLK